MATESIVKRPGVIYNNIADQVKTAISSLSVKDWNTIVNTLKTQANLNTKHVEMLYKLLFGSLDNTDARYIEFVDAYNTGLLQTLLDTLAQAQETMQLHIGPTSPPQLTTVLWIDTSED